MNTYGTLNLTESSPAQSWNEPLTLSEVKSYLHLPERSPADEAEDLEIEVFITGAREQGEIAQNRDLVRKQWDLSLDYWPGCEIQLRDPLYSVDLVQYKDSDGNLFELVEGADYIVDTAKHPGVILPAYGKTWPSFTPWPSSAILIRFTSGYAADATFWLDAGGRLKNGMKLLISAWCGNRLPFEIGAAAIQEYPYAVTACLSAGALERVR